MAHLPDDPDLGWLRKRAKEIKREHPGWKLADAQLDLARHYEFPSWPALKRYVELVRSYRRAPDEVGEQARPEDEFLRLACLTYGADDPQRRARAAGDARRRTRRSVPTTSGSRLRAATPTRCAGCLPATRRWRPPRAVPSGGRRCSTSPTPATTRTSPRPRRSRRRWPCCSRRGADPDAGYLWHGLPPPFTALTGCFGEGEGGPGNQPAHPQRDALARALLEAGADPNDAQTLYNRMFRPDDSHLELLFEFGLGRRRPVEARLGREGRRAAAGQLAWRCCTGWTRGSSCWPPRRRPGHQARRTYGGAGRTAYAAARGQRAGPDRRAAAPARRFARHAPATRTRWSPRSWPPIGPRSSDWWPVTRGCSPAPGRAPRAGGVGGRPRRPRRRAARAVELGWDVDRRARDRRTVRPGVGDRAARRGGQRRRGDGPAAARARRGPDRDGRPVRGHAARSGPSTSTSTDDGCAARELSGRSG